MNVRVLVADRGVRVAGHLTAMTGGRARNAAGRARIFADLLRVRVIAGRRRGVIRKVRRVVSAAREGRTSGDQDRSAGIFRVAAGMTADRRVVRHFAAESGAIFAVRLTSARCRRRSRAGTCN